MSSTKGVEVASIRTATLEVKDVKFIDDDELMLAASDKSKQYRLVQTFGLRMLTSNQSLLKVDQNPLPQDRRGATGCNTRSWPTMTEESQNPKQSRATARPVLTFGIQKISMHARGRNSLRVSLGPQRDWMSMVGRAEG